MSLQTFTNNLRYLADKRGVSEPKFLKGVFETIGRTPYRDYDKMLNHLELVRTIAKQNKMQIWFLTSVDLNICTFEEYTNSLIKLHKAIYSVLQDYDKEFIEELYDKLFDKEITLLNRLFLEGTFYDRASLLIKDKYNSINAYSKHAGLSARSILDGREVRKLTAYMDLAEECGLNIDALTSTKDIKKDCRIAKLKYLSKDNQSKFIRVASSLLEKEFTAIKSISSYLKEKR